MNFLQPVFLAASLALVTLPSIGADVSKSTPWPYDRPQNIGGFEQLSPEAIESTGIPPASFEATFHIRNTGPCTATKISDQGHFLTAYHCVANCLDRAGYFTEDILYTDSRDGTEQRLRYRAESPPPLVSCSFRVIDLRAGKSSAAHQIQADLIYGPRCLSFPARKPKGINSSYNANLSELPRDAQGLTDCDRSRDFIIFKAQGEALSNLGCTPVASGFSPHPGRPVVALGTPTATRRGVNDSLGRELYLSRGHITRSKACRIEYTNGSRLWTQIPSGIGHRVIQAEVDIVNKSSGGPLFNTKGEIIGVASGIESSLQSLTSYCRGASYFSNLEHLELKVRNILTCTQRSSQ